MQLELKWKNTRKSLEEIGRAKNGLHGDDFVAGDIAVPRDCGLDMLLDWKGMGPTTGTVLWAACATTPPAPEATRSNMKFLHQSTYVYTQTHVYRLYI